MNQDRHSVDFFEIKLEDLEEGTELRKKIREIKTAMVMTKKNDKLVKEAVDKIINSRSEDRQMSLAEEIVQSIGTGK
jgi:DNA polymerase III delta subunit